ncbi:Aspartate kinase [Gracilaria domingensis]|nr:Aspartate kinase [Gracilaria domingensis]
MEATFVSFLPLENRRSSSAQNLLSRRNGSRLHAPNKHRSVSLRRAAVATSTSPPPLVPPPLQAPTKLDRIVCKFGGSSLANADRLKEVTKLVLKQIECSEKMPIIVLSAMGPSTNELLTAGERALNHGIVDTSSIRLRAYEACETLSLNKEDLVDPLLHNLDELLVGIKFIKELSPRTLDYLVSFGERLSVRIFAAHLRHNENIPAEHVDAYDAGFVTNSSFTRAELLEESFGNIKRFFDTCIKDDHLAVVTGFIAKDQNGNITTLGRGGSDLTASTIGAALGTSEVQVWKDVDGILSTDPRIVTEALPIPSISFEEAAEMAFFGAKILHPIAMQPAMKYNVPVRVKNSYNPDHPGTVILRERALESRNPVTAISLKRNVQIVDIVSTRMLGASGFLAEVFKCFAFHKVSVDMIATSEVSISMTLDNNVCDAETLIQLKDDLSEYALVSLSERSKAIISLVSDSSRSSSVVGRAVSALDGAGVTVLMISQGASKFNISITVEAEDANTAVQVIHDEFFS